MYIRKMVVIVISWVVNQMHVNTSKEMSMVWQYHFTSFTYTLYDEWFGGECKKPKRTWLKEFQSGHVSKHLIEFIAIET